MESIVDSVCNRGRLEYTFYFITGPNTWLRVEDNIKLGYSWIQVYDQQCCKFYERQSSSRLLTVIFHPACSSEL